MRSMMFVPAHKGELIKKALGSAADAIILDLEDSCPGEENYLLGRENVKSNPGNWVRMRGREDEDLVSHVKGFIFPKSEYAQEVGYLSGATTVFALIETARGVMNCNEIAMVADGLVFGNEDYFADTGCRDYAFARGMIINSARANDIPAIDTVNVDVHDMDRLMLQCSRGAKMGFDGKLCIHPREIPTIHQYYTPSTKDYLHAKKVVTLYEQAVSEGSGVAIIEGVYVAPPMLKRAKKIIERYEAYDD